MKTSSKSKPTQMKCERQSISAVVWQPQFWTASWDSKCLSVTASSVSCARLAWPWDAVGAHTQQKARLVSIMRGRFCTNCFGSRLVQKWRAAFLLGSVCYWYASPPTHNPWVRSMWKMWKLMVKTSEKVLIWKAAFLFRLDLFNF